MRSASWPFTKAAMPARTRPSPPTVRRPGEIILFAPYKSALCYTQNPELTAERYKNGWFYTHDVGTWDAGHYVTVRGRRVDMIVCMGENIYPAQLEEVLCTHPKVADCMVAACGRIAWRIRRGLSHSGGHKPDRKGAGPLVRGERRPFGL